MAEEQFEGEFTNGLNPQGEVLIFDDFDAWDQKGRPSAGQIRFRRGLTTAQSMMVFRAFNAAEAPGGGE